MTESPALDPVEEEKRETLAAWVLKHFETKADRAEWLRLFEEKNGKRIADDIKARMTRIYREQKRVGR